MIRKYLIVFFVSMLPLIELRGAIPISQLSSINIPLWQAYIIAVLGNMVPVPFIYLFARKILVWGANKKWPKALKWLGNFFNFVLKKGEKGGKKITSKAKEGTFIALMLFVGIPLPGTGAWTGTLAASILDMDFKKSVIAILLGVLLAGIIMALISYGVFDLIFQG